ncbi:hypothetical protein EXIGLDRAFT_690990 [Exidia glandulosa HHB12029]|uniref:Uncharacterized protein n=1 Tax=Exidia glandulosa HHB12029 TaxID=1314781 RepID=A0A165P7I0_EXIGL|nr:hypothetical protein EXIGLDRAFT_690990 [Exidia glandulosa HHB12029]
MESEADGSAPSTSHSVLLAELALANTDAERSLEHAQSVDGQYEAAQERHRDAETVVEEATRTLKLTRDGLDSTQLALDRIRERQEAARIMTSSAEARIAFAQERLQLYTRQPDVLSPASSLPGDIVTEIFDCISVNRSGNAIRLSHINRRWRNLALSTPSLWTNLNSLYEPDAAHVFAARAAQLPLNVSIMYGPELPSYHRSFDKFSAFVAVAANYAHRWSRIHLGTCSRYMFKIAFTRITDALVASGATLPLSVASVSLRIYRGSWSSRDSETLGFESTWPFQAREALFSGLSCVPAACLVPSLVRLEIRDAQELFDMALISKAPRLETLVVDIRTEATWDSEAETVHTMPCLRRLRTDGLFPHSLLYLLLHIRMPALRHVDLTLTGTCADVLTVIRAFMRGMPIEFFRIRRTMDRDDFLTRSSLLPRIETFVAEITPSLPMLTRLNLENVQLDDGALKELTDAMPRLETLLLCGEEHVTVDGLRDIVVERLQSTATAIKCLHIVCSPQFNDFRDWNDIVELVPHVTWLNDDEEEEHADQEDAEASDAESETDSEIDAVLDDEEIAFIAKK